MNFHKYRKNAALKKMKLYTSSKPGIDWTLVSNSMKHRIGPILEGLNHNVTWTENGEVILNDVYYPKSNITKLILYHISQKKSKNIPKMYQEIHQYFPPVHRF